MTKLEKFLDAIAVCEQNGTLWTHVKVAELKEVLAGLGAAVSASPQPRCPKCRSGKLVFRHIDGSANRTCAFVAVQCPRCLPEGTIYLDSPADMSQFFAAAPAQEPKDAVCDQYGFGTTPEKPPCSCKPKPLNGQHWTGCPEGKVEEIARLAKSFVTRWVAERYVQKYPGHVLCEIDILAATELAKDFAVELLRHYFPPASQTPNTLFQKVITFLEECRDKAKAECGIYLTANHFETILESLKLATPASTARTDKSIAQTVRDAYNDYSEANPGWEDVPGAMEELRDTVESLLETINMGLNPEFTKLIAEACEQIDKSRPAAPGSVPQAPDSPKKSFLGLPVYVDNPQFTGYGMAAYDSGDRKRVIGVLLENGHTWEYDAATVREARHEELPKMPRFIRERFKPWAGAAQPGDDKPEGK